MTGFLGGFLMQYMSKFIIFGITGLFPLALFASSIFMEGDIKPVNIEGADDLVTDRSNERLK